MADDKDLETEDRDGASEIEDDDVEAQGGAEEGDEGEDDVDAQEDDAGDGDGDEEGEDVGDEPPARSSRGANRFQSLRNENKALTERLEKLERGGSVQAGPTQADIERARAEQQRRDDEELERASLEGPAAVARVVRQQTTRDFQATLNADRYHRIDRDDRADFREECRTVPAYAKLADRVESKLREMRAQGTNPSRIAIANFLIGEDAVKRAKGAATRQGKKGAARVDRERAPVRRGGRSDVAAGGRRRGGGDDVDALERRLSNVNI